MSDKSMIDSEWWTEERSGLRQVVASESGHVVVYQRGVDKLGRRITHVDCDCPWCEEALGK